MILYDSFMILEDAAHATANLGDALLQIAL
ncbi:hypothetical protein ACVWXE_001386 [Thermostichus sp. MS-CIW-41]